MIPVVKMLGGDTARRVILDQASRKGNAEAHKGNTNDWSGDEHLKPAIRSMANKL